jgi:hypothetical protein
MTLIVDNGPGAVCVRGNHEGLPSSLELIEDEAFTPPTIAVLSITSHLNSGVSDPHVDIELTLDEVINLMYELSEIQLRVVSK